MQPARTFLEDSTFEHFNSLPCSRIGSPSKRLVDLYNIERQQIKFKSLEDHRKRETFLLVNETQMPFKFDDLIADAAKKKAVHQQVSAFALIFCVYRRMIMTTPRMMSRWHTTDISYSLSLVGPSSDL